MTNLSSPNRIVWEYFEALRRLVRESGDTESDAIRRQSAASAVVMSVTVVEVFFNLWFRVRAEQFHSQTDVAQLVSELGYPRLLSLDKKLKLWPKRYLQKELDLNKGFGAEFMKIKALRNSIIHFNSSHTTFEYEGITLHGLADTTDYDALSFEKAQSALLSAENIIREVFLLAGVAANKIDDMMHAWTGRIAV